MLYNLALKEIALLCKDLDFCFLFLLIILFLFKFYLVDLLDIVPSVFVLSFQSTPLVVGTTIGAAALGARYLIRAWQTFKAAPRVRMFYPGGFDRDMTRREAALILGVRCDDLTLF